MTYCDVQRGCVDGSPSVSVLQGKDVIVWGRHRVDEPGQVVLHTASCWDKAFNSTFRRHQLKKYSGHRLGVIKRK